MTAPAKKPAYAKLKYPTMEPPGGWCYRDLQTNVWINSVQSLDDLVQKCIQHRRANSLEIPADFAAFIENAICYSIPPGLSIGIPKDRKVSEEVLTMFRINQRTNDYLLRWKQSGQKLVSQSDAEWRAESCLSCGMNRSAVCLTCKGVDSWIRGWTSGRRTPYDTHMHICACDAIVLYASLHADIEYSKAFQQAADYPKYCWKRDDVKRVSQGQQNNAKPEPAPGLVAAASAG